MNALTDTLTVLGIFLVLALPALIGLAYERRIDRQLRQAHRSRPDPDRRVRPHGFVTTTVTVHS